jgi:hypothetical protein
MIAQASCPQPHTPYLHPVVITRVAHDRDLAVTLIGDPHAALGAIEAHLVYPDSEAAVSEQGYVPLLWLFAAHLLAHADIRAMVPAQSD